MKNRTPLPLITLLLLTYPLAMNSSFADDQGDTARRAGEILKKNCHHCHGEDGSNDGGLNSVLDVRRLVAHGIVTPNDAAGSYLIQQITGTPPKMPKGEPPLSDDDIGTLRKWIDSGATDFSGGAPKRERISPTIVSNEIASHLESLSETDRQFTRYFTITHLFNAGIPDDQLLTYRNGLCKLLNSLSWGKEIVRPKAIDKDQTILCVDIRDFKWQLETWDRILRSYPYGVIASDNKDDSIAGRMKTHVASVRADWFVAAASTPPLYHDILDLPKNLADLEQRLQVDIAQNIRSRRVIRAAFDNSEPSLSNRMIERHETYFGYLWISYDTRDSRGRRHFKEFPQGPANVFDDAFEFDGSELIFSLPNGLQAYMLVNAEGNRIDNAPGEIVIDRKNPINPTISNGQHCMRCHVSGIIPKKDLIHEHVQSNRAAFNGELDAILELYPKQSTLDERYRSDAERFMSSLKEVGLPSFEQDPIFDLALRFEESLGLDLAAAEVGVTTADLENAIRDSARLARLFGPLKDGRTIPRDSFDDGFALLLEELKLGQRFVAEDKSRVATAVPVMQKSPKNGEIEWQVYQGTINKNPAVLVFFDFNENGQFRGAVLQSGDRQRPVIGGSLTGFLTRNGQNAVIDFKSSTGQIFSGTLLEEGIFGDVRSDGKGEANGGRGQMRFERISRGICQTQQQAANRQNVYLGSLSDGQDAAVIIVSSEPDESVGIFFFRGGAVFGTGRVEGNRVSIMATDKLDSPKKNLELPVEYSGVFVGDEFFGETLDGFGDREEFRGKVPTSP